MCTQRFAQAHGHGYLHVKVRAPTFPPSLERARSPTYQPSQARRFVLPRPHPTSSDPHHKLNAKQETLRPTLRTSRPSTSTTEPALSPLTLFPLLLRPPALDDTRARERNTATMVYIRQDKLPKLKEYKYQGVDHSLVSRYVLKPFYTHVVIKCFPMWMA